MNTIRNLAAALIILSGISARAQQNELLFKVYGNCTMCKNRIEKAVKALPGVNSFAWDPNSKQARLSIDLQKVTADNVKKKIAEAGHDTDSFRASEASYFRLPSCCQYERNTIIQHPAQKN